MSMIASEPVSTYQWLLCTGKRYVLYFIVWKKLYEIFRPFWSLRVRSYITDLGVILDSKSIPEVLCLEGPREVTGDSEHDPYDMVSCSQKMNDWQIKISVGRSDKVGCYESKSRFSITVCLTNWNGVCKHSLCGIIKYPIYYVS